MRGHHVAHAVAAELLAGAARELERDHGLGHDRGGAMAVVSLALDERLGRLVRVQARGAQRAHERGDRLHGDAHDDRLAVASCRPRPRPRGWSRAA